MKMLIVDDQPLNQKLARALFTAEGWSVETAADATGALESLAASLPDVVLTDIQLPDLDGLELTRRLRADARTANLTIVAVTAYAAASDREEALAAGCDAYVAKPIDTRALPRLVSDCLSERNR